MPKWPIRVKLIAGLSLVVGMMLTLMGGSIFGLRSFHDSNLASVDQLPEFGAASELFEKVVRLDAPRDDEPGSEETLLQRSHDARSWLVLYFDELKKNAIRGNHADDGRDAASLAFDVDVDLTAILAALEPDKAHEYVLAGTAGYLRLNPEVVKTFAPLPGRLEDLKHRIDRVDKRVMKLPKLLYKDFYAILTASRAKYDVARTIVWTSALLVLAMLCGLTALLHRWIVFPIRLLERGVRRVARGSFDDRIDLATGDEMQALAEAFNDMTERLREMYANLEQQVEERSRQLVRSERLAGVGFLAAGVAHEINNPLASIAFCSEALENRLRPLLDPSDSGDPKVVRQYVRMIQEEAFRCKAITEKLLDFSRVGDIQRVRTDLAGLIQGVVEMVRHIGKYRNKTIVFQPRVAVLADVDGQEIKQVVLNLVVNALESLDEGGTLRIELRYAEGKAEMCFADNGCGMPADILENIFEPFFTKRKGGKGTGLGLSITNRIVSQHHGEITATSPGEGRGATFTVRLPLHQTVEDSGQTSPKSTRAA
jgi:two-component system NtrC family sensor kinase